MSTAEKIFDRAKCLPVPAQEALLKMLEELSSQNSLHDSVAKPLTLQEAAELRGKLAAWEEDWSAPGMEAYDRP